VKRELRTHQRRSTQRVGRERELFEIFLDLPFPRVRRRPIPQQLRAVRVVPEHPRSFVKRAWRTPPARQAYRGHRARDLFDLFPDFPSSRYRPARRR